MPIPEDAPLFKLFWQNSTLNDTRGRVMAERIGEDSVSNYVAPRLRLPQAPLKLTPPIDNSATTWSHRQSGREFGDAAITAEQLSSLCWPFAARADNTRHSASGGGKYPIFIYAALLNAATTAFNKQLMWYDPQAHGFTSIAACPEWTTLKQALSVDWSTTPAAVFFITARSAGTFIKYGERGGRFMLLEAGSYMGALGYETARLGLAGVAVGSMHDNAIAKLLALDTNVETPVLAFACGTKKK